MPELIQSILRFFQPRPTLVISLAAGMIMGLAYLAIFTMTGFPGSWTRNIASALSNAVPLALWTYLTIVLLRAHVIGRPALAQLVLNAFAMPVFGLVWYVSVIVLLGWSQGSLTDGFSVSPFRGPAFTWQFFQGMTVYAAVAAAAYALEFHDRLQNAAPVSATAAPANAANSTLMLKQGDELRPVEISEIIVISGAGDYAEVSTAKGSHLSRKSLSEFESLLPSDMFVRVHRSRIVNLEAILQAEPAGGGRMTLQMAAGLSVSTSRAGARLIRDRSI